MENETKIKKEKVDYYTKGMDFAAPYYQNATADLSDRAQIFFWYTANFASNQKAIGIMESISTLPELFKLVDENIKIDPAFAPPYLLKGRIDVEVPGFLGGDDFRMGESFALALKYNSNDLNVLVDAADGFIKRNWDVNKKTKEKEKRQKSDAILKISRTGIMQNSCSTEQLIYIKALKSLQKEKPLNIMKGLNY